MKKFSDLFNFVKSDNAKLYISRLGFTLAEILIVIGIIGVVAEMTIPNLLSDFNKTQYVTRLKKVYTVGNEALKQLSFDNGCINDLACSGVFAGDTETVGKMFVQYFKVVKNCGIEANFGCWPSKTFTAYQGNVPSGYNNYDAGGGLYKFITIDGMSIAVTSAAKKCTDSASTGLTGNLTQICGNFYVDTNGLKPPNRWGKDTFMFYISNGKGTLLYPVGGKDSASNWTNVAPHRCGLLGNLSGLYCTGRIIEEGWQMNY